jgi:predicted transcriptional regulator
MTVRVDKKVVTFSTERYLYPDLKGDGMKVQELAAGPLKSCPSNASLSFAAWNLWVGDCKVLAVLEEGRTVGFVTEQDLPLEMPGTPELARDFTVAEIMRRTFPACRCEDDVENAVDLMTREGLPRLPVLDSEGRPWGLLSVNDALLKRRASDSRDHDVGTTRIAIVAG